MQKVLYRVDSPSVIFEQFDGELVAIHLTTGAYHSLLGTASDVFLLINQVASIDEVAEALQVKYDATAESIAPTLVPFFGSLIAEHLIVDAASDAIREMLQLEASTTKLPYVPPTLEAYHDLESLFLLDPVHEVGEQGWPQPLHTPDAGDAQAS